MTTTVFAARASLLLQSPNPECQSTNFFVRLLQKYDRNKEVFAMLESQPLIQTVREQYGR